MVTVLKCKMCGGDIEVIMTVKGEDMDLYMIGSYTKVSYELKYK